MRIDSPLMLTEIKPIVKLVKAEYAMAKAVILLGPLNSSGKFRICGTLLACCTATRSSRQIKGLSQTFI